MHEKELQMVRNLWYLFIYQFQFGHDVRRKWVCFMIIRNVYIFPPFFYVHLYYAYYFFKVSVLQKAKYGNINAIFYTKKFSIWSMEKNLKVFMTLLWTKYMISKWNFLKRHVWSKLKNFFTQKVLLLWIFL